LSASHRPPALRTALGTARIPIPLRTYPVLPALVEQSADPTVPEHPTLTDAGRWTFRVTYAHEHAAQDEVGLDVTVNVDTAAGQAAAAKDADPARALARYMAVADPLTDLLAAYGDPTGGEAGGGAGGRVTAPKAAASFAALADEVATAWQHHEWPPPKAPAADDAIYRYGIAAVNRPQRDGTELLSTVRLRLRQAEAGPAGTWPEIVCHTEGEPVALVRQTPDGLVCDYDVPESVVVPRTAWLTLTLRWAGLNVAQFQNATASLSVRRNDMLLGRPGPATDEAFVFQSGTVSAPAPASPFIVRPEPFDITAPYADVAEALTATLRELTAATEGVAVTICAWYSYELAPAANGADALRTRLPVTLLPRHEADAGTGPLVAGYLDEWLEEVPAMPGRQWQFSVMVHSGLSDAHDRPLLVVDQLRYSIATLARRPNPAR
jgi:hypothetical protein